MKRKKTNGIVFLKMTGTKYLFEPPLDLFTFWQIKTINPLAV